MKRLMLVVALLLASMPAMAADVVGIPMLVAGLPAEIPVPVDSPLTPLFNLRGVTDENGYLRVSPGTAGITDGPLTVLGALRGRTDENGYLRISCSSCALTTGTLAQFAATTSAQLAGVISDETGSGALVFATSPTLVTPTIGVASGTSLTNSVNGIGVVDFLAADDGLVLDNTTAATGVATVQGSPNIRWKAHSFFSGIDHVYNITETFVPSAALDVDSWPGGYLMWKSADALNGGAIHEMMRLETDGNLLTSGGVDVGFCIESGESRPVCQGDLSVSYNAAMYWRQTLGGSGNRAGFNSPRAGSINFYGDSSAGGRTIQMNVGGGAPTLSTCGTSPTMPSDATNAVGSLTTGTGATACTITWSVPWGGSPKCWFVDMTTTPNAFLTQTALSASASTFTVGASKAVYWHCFGNGS